MEEGQREGISDEMQELGCVVYKCQLHTRNAKTMCYERVRRQKQSGSQDAGRGAEEKWDKKEVNMSCVYIPPSHKKGNYYVNTRANTIKNNSDKSSAFYLSLSVEG